MKKNWISLLLVLSIALLTACGGTGAPAQGSVGGEVSTGGAASGGSSLPAESQGLPTAAQLGREERGTIEMTVEGEREEVLATLYIGEGYSLYIPDEGWEKDTDPEDREVSWDSVVNDDVELTVRVWPGMGTGQLDALFAAFEKTEDDFTFTVDGNTLVGADARDGETMIVYPHLSEADAYTVAIRYPDEAAEGFGTRLAAIAGTFSAVS